MSASNKYSNTLVELEKYYWSLQQFRCVLRDSNIIDSRLKNASLQHVTGWAWFITTSMMIELESIHTRDLVAIVPYGTVGYHFLQRFSKEWVSRALSVSPATFTATPDLRYRRYTLWLTNSYTIQNKQRYSHWIHIEAVYMDERGVLQPSIIKLRHCRQILVHLFDTVKN